VFSETKGRHAISLSAVARYPIPFFAFAGLVLGSLATWVAVDSQLGSTIWLLTLIIGGLPIVFFTIVGMYRGRFAADVVAMLAIVAAILFNEGFAGTVIVLMQSGGEALENYGLGRASSALDALAGRAPRLATRKEDGSGTVVPVEAVVPGDMLVVKKGELIPVDGVLDSVSAQIDESAVTGEPLPRDRSKGDELMSGSVNVGSAVEMKATRVSSESQYSKIVELVRHAQDRKPRIQRLADRYAVWFTPLTVTVAILGVVITSDPRTLLSVLVVATPCPLILATPIAVISGVNRAAAGGVIVKSGAALEEVADTSVVVFDKTGTLTYGVPSVEKFVPSGKWSGDDLLFYAAAVEQLSSHPIASSLASTGRERFGTLPVPTNFEEVPSRGVEGTVASHRVAVGLRKFCEERTGVPFPEDDGQSRNELALKGKLVTFVAIDGQPAGTVVFTDLIRPGVPYMVGRLHDQGVKEVVMLTGDNKQNAEAIARQTGITTYEADLLPSEKVKEVQRLISQYGTTVMVGDGINDAPALASASVGIAMGAKGTAISAEAADMVLLVDDITRVPEVLATGRKMDRVARQGINFGLGASLMLMAVATFGVIEPAVGAMLQEVIDVSVILNALRVR
jgi:heavy metal translocating P-type ATPase